MPNKARYVMIGGFLGAGKTTAVARLARTLADRGLKVGLIANDQSTGLVDTALLRSKGFATEEIAGGCFCCRFNSLLEAADKLSKDARPDVFIAEPVGSCTDLVATVSYPLRRIYGELFTIAPLSVLVDPARAARVLGLEPGKPFSEKVLYVYKKQLEEADVIVVNKIDTLDVPRRERLAAALRQAFPKADVLLASAKSGDGLDAWYERVLNAEGRDGASMELDYDVYAEGEALLGWLNATAVVAPGEPFDGNQALLDLARRLRARLKDVEIAHLKMTLDPGDLSGSLAVVSLVRSDAEPDLRESLVDPISGGELVVNLRAEADPALLNVALRESLDPRARLEHVESFRPARPRPTHRLTGGSR